MRVAIVGAGVSGLVAAHLLHREHEITVFEAGTYAGGHANTVPVETASGSYAVDTGFVVFNDRNYPRFERLLDRLGVASQPSDMSFSVADEHGDFEYNASSPNGLFAKRAHVVTPWFHRMLADVVRFQRAARALLDGDADPSLAGWLEEQRFSRPFVERLIVPQTAAVWSADPRQMSTFPAKFLATFFDNHGMLGLRGRPRWKTVAGGSQSYVEALVRPWRDRLRLAAPVRSITRDDDGVTVEAVGSEPARFDQVVLACHADQALSLLRDPSDREHELLGAFPYQPNEAVLHTDRRLLPRRRRAWASWNYHLLDEPNGAATVTYHMNRLQSLPADRELCVTLNRTAAIDPSEIVAKIPYAHPVYTPAGHAAQPRHEEISSLQQRTHFAGAYWGWGFHEDGVASGARVAEVLGGARL